ncbi:hypothetical protein ACLOJK_023106 [Asimina triloba]
MPIPATAVSRVLYCPLATYALSGLFNLHCFFSFYNGEIPCYCHVNEGSNLVLLVGRDGLHTAALLAMTLWSRCYVFNVMTTVGWVGMMRLSNVAVRFRDAHCYRGCHSKMSCHYMISSSPTLVGIAGFLLLSWLCRIRAGLSSYCRCRS